MIRNALCLITTVWCFACAESPSAEKTNSRHSEEGDGSQNGAEGEDSEGLSVAAAARSEVRLSIGAISPSNQFSATWNFAIKSAKPLVLKKTLNFEANDQALQVNPNEITLNAYTASGRDDVNLIMQEGAQLVFTGKVTVRNKAGAQVGEYTINFASRQPLVQSFQNERLNIKVGPEPKPCVSIFESLCPKP